MSSLINRKIGVEVIFNYTHHGFRAGQGMGSTFLEVKLLQQPTSTREEVLYKILIELKKAYNALYW